MERYLDEGAKSYSPLAMISEVQPRYHPRSDYSSFGLISVSVPRSEVTLLQAEPQKELLEFYVSETEVRFLIHPEVWQSSDVDRLDELRACPLNRPIQVAPTASTRTVFTTQVLGNVPAHFIKLHCPRRISRFIRRLRRKDIATSVHLSQQLAGVRHEKFAYLPDCLGALYGNQPASWGFLVREKVPRPFREGGFLIPLFALYGGDLREPEATPLLVQMIGRLKVSPQTFVLDEIMIPILECWCEVAREKRILLESHAQNPLLEVDREFRPRRIAHRDLDVWVDDGTWPYSKERIYSLIYEHFLGRELFDYLLGLLKRFFAVDEEAVRGRVRETFRKSFPDWRNFFPPDTTYYFSDEILSENEFRLIDTGQAPRWR